MDALFTMSLDAVLDIYMPYGMVIHWVSFGRSYNKGGLNSQWSTCFLLQCFFRPPVIVIYDTCICMYAER